MKLANVAEQVKGMRPGDKRSFILDTVPRRTEIEQLVNSENYARTDGSQISLTFPNTEDGIQIEVTCRVQAE